MTTFLALTLVLGFIHATTMTFLRHQDSESVRQLWSSPYRYNYFRPADDSSGCQR